MCLRKKLFAFVITAVLLCSVSVISVNAASYPCLGVVVGSDVNVRSGPGTEHEILSTTGYGVLLDVFGQTGNWFKIGIGEGKIAYISADYVSLDSQTVSSRGNMIGGNRVVQLAKQYLGVPYVYGGSSPSGFDCSGFTSYIYGKLGYSINRVAHDQLANGIPIEKNELQPGDLVMFKRPGNTYVHHVGIYVGDGMMIHAPQTGEVVKYTSIVSGYYGNVYYAARRIIR